MSRIRCDSIECKTISRLRFPSFRPNSLVAKTCVKLNSPLGRAPLIVVASVPWVGKRSVCRQDWVEVRWPNLLWRMSVPFGDIIRKPQKDRPTETALQSKANTQHTGNCVAHQQSMAGHFCDRAVISFGSSQLAAPLGVSNRSVLTVSSPVLKTQCARGHARKTHTPQGRHVFISATFVRASRCDRSPHSTPTRPPASLTSSDLSLSSTATSDRPRRLTILTQRGALGILMSNIFKCAGLYSGNDVAKVFGQSTLGRLCLSCVEEEDATQAKKKIDVRGCP